MDIFTEDPPDAKELFFRTRICKFFQAGKCKRGKLCSFAHGDRKVQPLPDFYKTRLCADILRTGECLKGDQCSYAHGKEDMRHEAKPIEEATKVTQAKAARAAKVEQSHQASQAANARSEAQAERMIKVLNGAAPVGMIPRNSPARPDAVPIRPPGPVFKEQPGPVLRQQPDPIRFDTRSEDEIVATARRDLDNLVARMWAMKHQANIANNASLKYQASIADHASRLQTILADQDAAAEINLAAEMLTSEYQKRVAQDYLAQGYEKRVGQVFEKRVAHKYDKGVAQQPQNRVTQEYEQRVAQAAMQLQQPMVGGRSPAGMPAPYRNHGLNPEPMFQNTKQRGGRKASVTRLSEEFESRLRDLESRNADMPGLSGGQTHVPQALRSSQEQLEFPWERRFALGSQGHAQNSGQGLPGGLLVKNTFLEAGPEQSDLEPALPQYAVRTLPDLPPMYSDMTDHSFSDLGGHEEQGLMSMQPRNDFDMHPTPSFGLTGCGMMDPQSPSRNASSYAEAKSVVKSVEHNPPAPVSAMDSQSSLAEMIVKNTFLELKNAESAMKANRIQSLPDLPLMFMTGEEPGHMDSPWDAGRMDSKGIDKATPGVRDDVQYITPPPGLISPSVSLSGSMDGADISPPPGLMDTGKVDGGDTSSTYSFESDEEEQGQGTSDLMSLGSWQNIGKGLHPTTSAMGMTQPDGLAMQAASAGFPQRHALAGSIPHQEDLGVVVKNTFLEAAYDAELAAALAKHAVRTAPELPLLSSFGM